MPAHAALLRYPHGRVLLARTKLAYVHLRNLLSDAKRDRTARVAGYVGIWLPEEFVLLFLRDGEPVNALSVTVRGVEPIPIAGAIARVPAEPEFGAICFHEAPVDQLVCMYHTLRVPPNPWPSDVTAGDPRVLFPHLRDANFEGVIEVIMHDTVNYIVLRGGLIEQMYLADDFGEGRTEQLARLFGPPSPRPRAKIRGWHAPLSMPAQAPPGLVAAYRELIDKLYGELATNGVPVPSAVGERVRDTLVGRHRALLRFTAAGKQEDPAEDQDEVTAAVAAWVSETVREALDGDDSAAARVIKTAARDRRHMLHAAGFLSALPWEIEW